MQFTALFSPIIFQEQNLQSESYRKIMNFNPLYFADCDGPWKQPANWTGGLPVVYRHFQDATGLTLVNGAEIVTGKVSKLLTILIIYVLIFKVKQLLFSKTHVT